MKNSLALAQVDFPVALTIHTPFPTQRLAQSALKTLAVDAELSPLVLRELALVSRDEALNAGQATANIEDKAFMKVVYRATTNRMLRVAVNGFMESLRLIVNVMEELDTDVLENGKA